MNTEGELAYWFEKIDSLSTENFTGTIDLRKKLSQQLYEQLMPLAKGNKKYKRLIEAKSTLSVVIPFLGDRAGSINFNEIAHELFEEYKKTKKPKIKPLSATIRLDPCWDISPGSICRRGGAGCPLPHEDDCKSFVTDLDQLDWHQSVYTLSFDPKKIGIQFPHNANKRQLKQFMKKLRKIDKQFLKIPYSS